MIPKIVWSYWDQTSDVKKWPYFYQVCYESWRRHLPEPKWSIHILSADNLDEFISRRSLPKNFDDLLVQRKSDCVRLALLKKYGGVWLDTGILLQKSLDWVIDLGVENVGYYNQESSTTGDNTVVENWFLASSPDNYIIRRWHKTFKKALDKYTERDLHTCPIITETDCQKIGKCTYLFMHIVYQHLLQTDPTFREKHDESHLQCAQTTGFCVQTYLKWDFAKVNLYLFLYLASGRRHTKKLFSDQPLLKWTGDNVLLLNLATVEVGSKFDLLANQLKRIGILS